LKQQPTKEKALIHHFFSHKTTTHKGKSIDSSLLQPQNKNTKGKRLIHTFFSCKTKAQNPKHLIIIVSI
jgi:hypothetical protein